MKKLKTIIPFVLSAALLLAVSGCGEAPKVAKSECKAVVAHVKTVLGKFAPSEQEMLSQCKAASDEARGCVMAAAKPMKLSQCDFG
ncbi:MAG: hypothetical protein HRU25_05805 [Psychrobium sp.]|nr:hypothetical protein [Psychrobium sp.]